MGDETHITDIQHCLKECHTIGLTALIIDDRSNEDVREGFSSDFRLLTSGFSLRYILFEMLFIVAIH